MITVIFFKITRIPAKSTCPGPRIQYADQIIVLDDGKMVGIGTHDSLLAENEVYQEIYYSQFPKEAAGNEK